MTRQAAGLLVLLTQAPVVVRDELLRGTLPLIQCWAQPTREKVKVLSVLLRQEPV